MLLLTREKLERTVAVEVQEEYAALTEKNASLNGLSDKMQTVCTDVREYKSEKEFDLIYTNPYTGCVIHLRKKEKEQT